MLISLRVDWRALGMAHSGCYWGSEVSAAHISAKIQPNMNENWRDRKRRITVKEKLKKTLVIATYIFYSHFDKYINTR